MTPEEAKMKAAVKLEQAARFIDKADQILREGHVDVPNSLPRLSRLLDDNQEYLDWLDGMLNLGSPVPDTSKWRRTNGLGAFEFEIADDPQDLEDRLRIQSQAGRTVRLVSSYNRPWKTKGGTTSNAANGATSAIASAGRRCSSEAASALCS